MERLQRVANTLQPHQRLVMRLDERQQTVPAQVSVLSLYRVARSIAVSHVWQLASTRGVACRYYDDAAYAAPRNEVQSYAFESIKHRVRCIVVLYTRCTHTSALREANVLV
jgi:hypothetical protein